MCIDERVQNSICCVELHIPKSDATYIAPVLESIIALKNDALATLNLCPPVSQISPNITYRLTDLDSGL